MKLSTRSRYGLIAIIDLAVEYGNGPIPLSKLAQSQGVSEAYLEQLLRALKNNGIIDASRGISGGYLLKIPPEKISAGDIIYILEGHTTLVDCVSTDKNAGCERACMCAARPLFLNLQNKIDDVLNHTMISDLTKDYIEQKKRLEKK